ncbi:response regulator transcription factor [Deinococcus sp.]|uniref:response regulator transcription factor n=1 Tax=Deinococcus sp. TaxID=47478 RepID=UPI003CC63401
MSTASSQAPILIVEDEPDLADILESYLRQGGYQVRHAADGFAALECFFEARPALVLLDLMLPRLSGLEVLRSIREAPTPHNATPIIALTARGSQEDRLRGFASGADDYVVKPYWPREVVARVRAALSRRGVPVPRILSGFDRLSVDVTAREVTRRGERIALRPAEFDLLATLLEARGRVYTRSELLEVIRSGESWALERTVDSHITRLRAKLGAPHGIETVHGVGYRYAR